MTADTAANDPLARCDLSGCLVGDPLMCGHQVGSRGCQIDLVLGQLFHSLVELLSLVFDVS